MNLFDASLDACKSQADMLICYKMNKAVKLIDTFLTSHIYQTDILLENIRFRSRLHQSSSEMSE